jgi:hypothetical protein
MVGQWQAAGHDTFTLPTVVMRFGGHLAQSDEHFDHVVVGVVGARLGSRSRTGWIYDFGHRLSRLVLMGHDA